jgi:hypothetical protein
MTSLVAVAIGLVLFFCFILYFCVRESKQDEYAQSNSELDLMRKSPFGRWRY